MDGKVLYVRDFFANFVKSQAARSKRFHWVAQSTKFAHSRYFLLMQADPTAQFYGVYRIMIAVSATGSPPGLLAAEDGTPFSTAQLSALTHIAQKPLVKALTYLIEKRFLHAADSVEAALEDIELCNRENAPTGAPSAQPSSERNALGATRKRRSHPQPQTQEEEEKRPAPSSPDPRGAGPLDGPRAVQRLLAEIGVSRDLADRLSANPAITPAVLAPLLANRPDDLKNPDAWLMTVLRRVGIVAEGRA